MADRFCKMDRANIEEYGPIDSHEAEIGEFARQALQRVSADVLCIARPNGHIVPISLDVIDFLDIQRVKPMLALTHQKLRLPANNAQHLSHSLEFPGVVGEMALPHPRDRVGEAIGVYRLYQIVDRAFLNSLLREIRLMRRHDAKTSCVFAQISQYIESGHVRQCDINEQQIRSQAPRSIDGRPA